MATEDDQVPVEELAKLATTEDGGEGEVGSAAYKAPAKVDLETLKKMDEDDESLKKYKEKLLAGSDNILDEGGPNVLVKALVVSFPEDPAQKEIELDLTGDLNKLKDTPIVVKDGAAYNLTLKFRVQREIVSGLRFHYNLYRKGIKVDTQSYMIGSFGPSNEPTSCLLCKDHAPSGMIARGVYLAKSQFIDDDKNTHLQCEWSLKIKKDWK